MDDLTKCLYQFVREKQMGNLTEDAEYEEAALSVELQAERVSAYLNAEQRKELYWLMDAVAFRDSIENEYVFQAALSLARELSGLVRIWGENYPPSRSFSFTPSRAGTMTRNRAPLPMPWTRVPKNWGIKAAIVPAIAQPARA